LCAVSALAERPALVERTFVTKEYNEQGIYMVRICKNGEWQNVILDDYFPCFPNGGPIFSRSNGNELWVLLLEKAYAKIHGGYKNLTAGSPYHAMMDLSGCPTMSLNFKDPKVKEVA
jgi:Calpain family cysteine protease